MISVSKQKWGQAVSTEIRALVPVALGSEDIEFVGITDVISRAQIEVVVATVEEELDVQLMKGTCIRADCRLGDVGHMDFDAVIVPGGVPGAMRLGESQLLREIVLRHHEAGAVVAGICLAPAVALWPTGILASCERITGNPLPIKTSERSYPPEKFTAIFGERFDPDARVCVDAGHRIVTSQAPGTTLEFALAIVGILRGEAVADEIARYLRV